MRPRGRMSACVFTVCISVRRKKKRWERGKTGERWGERRSECQQKWQLSIQPPRRRSCPWQAAPPFGWCRHGNKHSPLVLLAACVPLPELYWETRRPTLRATTSVCTLAKSVAGVQHESQPASVRALHHDSAHAGAIKDKLLDATQYRSPNGFLSSQENKRTNSKRTSAPIRIKCWVSLKVWLNRASWTLIVWTPR